MMTTGSATERQFRLAWPRWQPPPGTGLVALVTQPDATLGWADALLARDQTSRYVWTSRPVDLERSALEILMLPEVRAAALAPDGADPREIGLALEVAERLSAERRHCAATDPFHGACLTSWSPPTPPPGTVRVPHLVTVRQPAAVGGCAVSDAVVWELTSSRALRRWLGGPPPDPAAVEASLGGLLWLRAAVRDGRLPATAAAARLASLLGSNDLSIEMVYQRFDLFRLLLGDRDGAPTWRV